MDRMDWLRHHFWECLLCIEYLLCISYTIYYCDDLHDDFMTLIHYINVVIVVQPSQ